ncbi:ribosome maturation factor RimP [Eubacteriaceae bacterium ES3]|nr:ribosome maturation factor RimP [Eubacteriaceae bacterium ES3]
MKKQSKEEYLEELLEPIVTEAGYQLYDLTFEKKGKDWVLVLYIDAEQLISLNDCETVSRIVSDFLDEKDPIEQSYFLEVSSPGLDRTIKKEKHYLSNIDKRISVNLFAPINGKKEMSGLLKKYQPDTITILLDDGELINLEIEKISKANRVDEIDFSPQQKQNKEGV